MFKKAEREKERERDHHDPVAPVKINVTHHLKISFLLSFFFSLKNCKLQKQAKDSEQVQHAIKPRSRLEIISYKT